MRELFYVCRRAIPRTIFERSYLGPKNFTCVNEQTLALCLYKVTSKSLTLPVSKYKR